MLEAMEGCEAPTKVSPGMQAELAQQDEEMLGRWYPVVVNTGGARGGTIQVQHLELTDEEDQYLVERVKLPLLRPLPPENPEGFLEALKPGALAEMSHVDGDWREVTVVKRTPAGKFTVEDRHKAKHTVKGDKLRPGWAWEPGVGHWKQREQQSGSAGGGTSA
uniref:Agenet-like domain-containing protein n=1 Tax=Haptolina brevifila TaxID=156173 RepID=A0A7S2BSM4_9EUKA